MGKEEKEKYIDIADKASSIVSHLGYSVYDNKGEYLGEEFEYDKLSMSYSQDTVHTLIYIGKIKVLDYNSDTDELEYISGDWIELINILYDKIPEISKQKRIKEQEYEKKSLELNSLKEYFKDCIIYSQNKGFLERLNNNLKEYNIQISKHTLIINQDNTITSFSIIENDKIVAIFNGDENDIFPEISSSIKTFTPGKWTEIFKKIIIQTLAEEQTLIQNSLSHTTSQILKKLKK